MKRAKRLLLLAVMLSALAALLASSAAAGDKVTICHKPGTPDEVMIEVSLNALDAHLAHGDNEGACPVVDVLTCPFDSTSIPVVGSDPVMVTVDVPPAAEPAYWLCLEPPTDPWKLAFVRTGLDPAGSWVWGPLLVVPCIPGGYDSDTTGVFDLYAAKADPTQADFAYSISCFGPSGYPPTP